MDGVINIFKTKGMTSHDVVSFLRKKLKIKKIGHAGTLDPNASGVLPLCIGKGTKIAEYLLDLDKEYISELTLGLRTDTQDIDGKVISTSHKIVNREEIRRVMSNYSGELQQVPPMYSALKYKGKKLYELAREGKVISREARNITIFSQEIIDIVDCKSILFYTKCSKGTYIRTLCDDIGEELGTYGYMSFLMRTGVGDFKIENSYGVDYLKDLTIDEISNILIPVDKAIKHIPHLDVDKMFYKKLINGNSIQVSRPNDMIENRNLRVYCGGDFIGIGKINKQGSDYILKMDKVLMI
ncbi:MAG: tRNA pseudouridine(55) synthase TruB [Tissierellaceae bacterium]|nr:tRNA pseudouridine(55) synthase TruB [Tissierellaceae bacterium]